MPDSQKVQFIPFHAINEFMRNDYRLSVVRTTLGALPDLPDSLSRPVENLTKKLVKVPGFRHSDKAPPRLRVLPTAEAFEKHAELVAAILAAWTEVHPDLRQKVYDLLVARGWEILPLEVERARLPGFGLKWRPGDDFETLVKAFQESYPQEPPNSDDICLMIVWVAARLPYPGLEEQGVQADVAESGVEADEQV